MPKPFPKTEKYYAEYRIKIGYAKREIMAPKHTYIGKYRSNWEPSIFIATWLLKLNVFYQ